MFQMSQKIGTLVLLPVCFTIARNLRNFLFRANDPISVDEPVAAVDNLQPSTLEASHVEPLSNSTIEALTTSIVEQPQTILDTKSTSTETTTRRLPFSSSEEILPVLEEPVIDETFLPSVHTNQILITLLHCRKRFYI
uniref:Uncharacterized protein n=1 Tax=Nephroselmis olivacea TaxID=31312 RepID=Q9T367_NEPOL|nr:hypothetical protein NeolCp087 [Nephroselmis olivacea]NP_050955.1 hypothetical protein NeolCp150 [Nephroselmis olivacea]AAD54863.1 unknown [Nephroselmis olivacea]AAD54926.1 unknown [Nephroselmis olivacea]